MIDEAGIQLHSHDTRRRRVAGQPPARSRDPINKVKETSRAERTVRARVKGVEEGIQIGKRKSAEKIEEQKTLIKERDEKIKKEEKQIKGLQITCAHITALLAG